MVTMAGPNLCFVGFILLCSSYLVNSQIETSKERLQELCSRYKFLWSDADPSLFYYCFTNKAAVQLRCKTGFSMCKRAGKAFHPCDCKQDNGQLNVKGNKSFDKSGITSMQDPVTKEFPSNGCPDPFMKYRDYHRFGGKEMKDLKTLGECQSSCINSADCIGLDWMQGQKQCFNLGQNAEKYGLSPKKGNDHYMRALCATTYAVTQSAKSATPKPSETEASAEDSNSYDEDFNEFLKSFGNDLGENVDANSKQGQLSGTRPPFTTTTDATRSTTTTAPVTTTQNIENVPVSFHVPDTGCPYGLQLYRGRSHPFGRNISSGSLEDPESCKMWCMLRPYCKGVDFDTVTKTCYYFQQIQDLLTTEAPPVLHFRKVHCGRPLNCWEATGYSNDPNMIAISDPKTKQVQCVGYCYLRETIGPTNLLIQRGCLTFKEMDGVVPRLGCDVSGSSPLSAQCVCATDRCNGLSMNAMSTQILYLPLNGNLDDQSGQNRFGVTASGYKDPQFSCLDRAVNCSALFTGSQCIEVRQMAQTAWGSIDSKGMVTPQTSFVAWVKRLPDGNKGKEGIFGNSNSASVDPSFSFVGTANENFIEAGVDSEGMPGMLNDFKRGSAGVNEWHLLTLTYDGRNLNYTMDVPMTKFFVDGKRQSGNEQNDVGPLVIRQQPVTIGCVKGRNFTGFIDEVRIFTSVLQVNDIEALRIMYDAAFA